MLIKAMILPMVLVICFGGYFVARTNPFNPKAVAVIASLAISTLLFGFAPGYTRVFGAIGMLVSIFALYAVRGKR